MLEKIEKCMGIIFCESFSHKECPICLAKAHQQIKQPKNVAIATGPAYPDDLDPPLTVSL